MIYTAPRIRILMRADGNLEFCGPQIALAYRLVQFHRGPQNSRFPSARIKILMRGAI
jgi:hypothetical protein